MYLLELLVKGGWPMVDLSYLVVLLSPIPAAFWTLVGTIIGAFVTARVSRANQMRTHNFATLASLTQSEGHSEAYSTVMQFLSKQSPGTISLEALRSAPDVEKQLIVMLAMYQFMAFAVVTGLIDRKLVQRQFLPSMKNLVDRFQAYIDHFRASLDRPTALSELTDFVKRYG